MQGYAAAASARGRTRSNGPGRLIVERRESETGERLLKRFQLLVQRAGILGEHKRRRHFISNSEARRMARAKAARRARKNAAKALATTNHVRRRP